MDPIVIDNLTKRYGRLLATDSLSFSVRAGRITGFLGPNGAGKTTTLRALLGLVGPTDGSASFAGTAYADLKHPMHHVGAVLEATTFHPGRRARDQLKILATAASIATSRVDAVLSTVDLAAASARRVGAFSLGMRQRLALASALLGDPEILILDEPTNGLDPEGVRWLRGFLRDFAAGGGTVLVSSHVLAEVAQTVDDVVIISGGRLVASGSLAELERQRLTATGVVFRTPEPARARAALAAAGLQGSTVGDEVTVAAGTPGDVGSALGAAGVTVHEMRSIAPSLEDIFIQLTQQPEGSTR